MVDTVIVGTITPFGDNLRITIKILDTETGMSVGATSGNIARTEAINKLFDNKVASSSSSGSSSNTGGSASGEGTSRTSKDPNCKEKNTGDYCFQNNTKFDLMVIFYPYNASNYLISTLQPGQKQCFIGVQAGTASYRIESPDAYYGYTTPRPGTYKTAQGSLYVDPCQVKTFIINSPYAKTQ